MFVCAGRKGAQFIARTKRTLAAEFTYKDTPQFGEARAISKFVQEMFLKGEVDAGGRALTRTSSTRWSRSRRCIQLLPDRGDQGACRPAWTAKTGR